MKELDIIIATSGDGFAEDAVPFLDLKEDEELPVVERNGAVYLRGSRCGSSGSLAFPARRVCLESGARDMEPLLFGPAGVLYSYTAIHVSAARSVPYSLGYVDFPNGVRVLAQVEESDAGAPIACDQPVDLRTDGPRWFVVPVAVALGGWDGQIGRGACRERVG